MLDLVTGRIAVFKCTDDPSDESYEVLDMGSVLEEIIDQYRYPDPLFEGTLQECLLFYRALILIMEWSYLKGFDYGINREKVWSRLYSEKNSAS